MKLHRKAILLGVFAAVSVPAVVSAAETSFEGKVSVVEPSYLPTHIAFQMYAGNSTCPSGAWLNWTNTDTEQVRGVYATLLTALASGKKVRFYMLEGDTACNGTHLHLLDF